MKVLICNIHPLDLIGGLDTYGKELIRNLKGDLYLCAGKNRHSKKIKKISLSGKKIKLIEYEQPWFLKSKKYFWPIYHQKNFKERMNELKKNGIKFDLIIYLHSALVTPVGENTRIIFIMPSCNNAYYNKIKKEISEKDKITWRILLNLERKIINNNKVTIIVLSRFMKRLLTKLYPQKKARIRVIPPGMQKRKVIKEKKTIEVLTVTRLDPIKNLSSLIRVAKKLMNRKFTIVGGGHYEKNIKKEILNNKIKNVDMVGEKSNPYPNYQKSKVFVLPSKYESFGLVLLEAMAFGLPCIAFKPDGRNIATASDEIIKQGKTGFLVKDEKEMADKINFLLDNNELREKMGNDARKEARKYSWEKCAREILKLAKNY